MLSITNEKEIKKRPLNVTIREDVLKEAKDLKLNASQAAEFGIIDAIKKARSETWLKKNKKAIQAYNNEIEKRGMLLTPSWLEDN